MRPQKYIIHKAIEWRKMLDDGEVKSLSEIAKKESLTRTRVTQIMNLLKLSADFREFLLGLEDPKEIRKYSERRLRGLEVEEKKKKSVQFAENPALNCLNNFCELF